MSTVSDYIGNDDVSTLFGNEAEETPTPQDEFNEAPAAEVAEEPGQVAEAIAPPATPAPAAMIEKPATATDDHYFDQLDLLAKMAECERKRAELTSELAEVDEDRKDLKSRLKACLLDMQEIASDIADLMANTYIPERKQFAAEPAPKAESEAPGQETETVVAEWGDGEWRNASTASVMDGTKGLGKKKLEALVDLAPTIGELEDLRATSYGVFKNVLPQGFGDKVAGEIEDRLIEYIAKHSVPPASEQVKQLAVTAINSILSDDEEGTSFEQVVGFVETFRNDAEIEKWDATDCDFDNHDVAKQCTSEMEQGFDACNDGNHVADYPREFTAGQLSDWAYGYVCAEVMQRIKSESEAPGQELKIAETDQFADL